MHLSMRVSLRKQFSLEAPGAVAWIQAECRVALFLECLNTPAGKDYGVARQQDRGRRTAPAERPLPFAWVPSLDMLGHLPPLHGAESHGPATRDGSWVGSVGRCWGTQIFWV